MDSLNNLFQALVITLREGIEASLVVGIVLAYLVRAGKPELRRPVWIAVIAAIAGSFAVALAIFALGIDPENEFREGIMFFAAGLMVGTFVIWMWRQGKHAKDEIEDKLHSIVSVQHKGVLGSAIGLFAFVFFMILREGIETVMFMLALGEDAAASPAYNLIGGSLGIALAAGFAFLLFKGSLRINLGTFFSVTSAVLLVLSLKLLAGGIHEWTEVEILPATDAWMSFIGWLAKDSISTTILMALIGLPAFFVFWESLKIKPHVDEGESLAQRRKQEAAAGTARNWGMAAGALGLTIMLALGGTQAAIASSRHDPAPQTIKAEVDKALVYANEPDGLLIGQNSDASTADQATIPAAELEDGMIHKYTYSSDKGTIRFMIHFDGEQYHAAYDTCMICPAKGFLQEGEETLVCKNCNAPIDMGTLGESGGCNPMPMDLEVEVDGDNVVIDLSDIMDPEVMAKMHGYV